MTRRLLAEIARRADSRCEYCKIPEHVTMARFEIDHIIPKVHGGNSHFQNLAYSSWQCNNAKGTNQAGIDDRSKQIVRLFHPRLDQWSDHFRWRGSVLIGKTATGRATIAVLKINQQNRVRVRVSLRREGITF